MGDDVGRVLLGTPLGVGPLEQLFGGLAVCFDHGLQSMATEWVFNTVYVHSKVGLQEQNIDNIIQICIIKCVFFFLTLIKKKSHNNL